MSEDISGRLFEHNNWANLRIIEVCSTLTDEQLDAEPRSATKGSIRATLMHLANSQQSYLSLLTLPVDARQKSHLGFSELQKAVSVSGERLLALAKADPDQYLKSQLQTTDGYFVEPWVVMVQIINHATEHREQICSMLSALGVTPPALDGWSYGEATNTLIPMPK
jgi:uncharacterized damage-inducible protein DinB